jgi:hypothetical protein
MMDLEGNYRTIKRKLWAVGSSINFTEPVKANYGVIRVMQSIFMASNKMSCTNIKCGKYSINPNSKSAMGGSKKLGEMELAQLEACGFKAFKSLKTGQMRVLLKYVINVNVFKYSALALLLTKSPHKHLRLYWLLHL